MALTFRKAVPSERDDAERILWSAFTLYVRNLGREITADHYAFLSAAIERGDVYFAVDGSAIVGVAATERRDGGIYIDRLGVDPARQGTVRLYRRHGFEIVSRGPPSHDKDPHIRVYMVKSLA